MIVLNHITKLSFTWTCSRCEFTIEQLPLRRRPLPCMGHKGFIYFICRTISKIKLYPNHLAINLSNISNSTNCLKHHHILNLSHQFFIQWRIINFWLIIFYTKYTEYSFRIDWTIFPYIYIYIYIYIYTLYILFSMLTF